MQNKVVGGVRRRLMAAVALGASWSGCVDRSIGDGEGDGGGTGGASSTNTGDRPPTSGTVTSGGGMTSASGGDTSAGSGDDTAGDSGYPVDVGPPPTFDIGGPPDPPESCDGLYPEDGITGEKVMDWPDTCLDPGRGEDVWYVCLPPPSNGGPCGEYSDLCVMEAATVQLEGADSCGGPWFQSICAADPDAAGQCCYHIFGTPGVCPGRPFVVHNEARLASLVSREDWTRALGAAPEMDTDTRRVLAGAWRQEARFEHASVASFSRFVLELLAMGAPAELVAAAVQATGEEIEHGRAFFGLAQRYDGETWGPDGLEVTGALDASSDPVAVVRSTITEGCIAETISAMALQHAHARATDPIVRRVLAPIVEQELRHAELAWRFVAWALPRLGAAGRDAVVQAFEQAHQFVPAHAVAREGDPTALAAHGQLSGDERQAVAQLALAQVIGPCARELLGHKRATESRRGAKQVGPGSERRRFAR